MVLWRCLAYSDEINSALSLCVEQHKLGFNEVSRYDKLRVSGQNNRVEEQRVCLDWLPMQAFHSKWLAAYKPVLILVPLTFCVQYRVIVDGKLIKTGHFARVESLYREVRVRR